MARIIYGVAGEGFGHSSRSHVIGKRLITQGHDVMFLASRKSLRYLRRYFGDRVKQVFGLCIEYNNGDIDFLQTVRRNLKGLPRGYANNSALFRNVVEPFAPDLVISDFEPFSAWWAWNHNVRSISIDHEHFLTMCRLDSPAAERKARFLARAVTRCYHTGADQYLILNFFNAPVIHPAAVLTPPVVRSVVEALKPSTGEHILVYSTDLGNHMRSTMLDCLTRFGRQRFHIYGFDREETIHNCVFRSSSTGAFLSDLAGCRAVVATGGFSLISEVLHFRKPMLLLPVQGQFEQMINAAYFEKLSLGRAARKLEVGVLGEFLDALNVPTSDHADILWPNNRRVFDLLDETLSCLGLGGNTLPAGELRA